MKFIKFILFLFSDNLLSSVRLEIQNINEKIHSWCYYYDFDSSFLRIHGLCD